MLDNKKYQPIVSCIKIALITDDANYIVEAAKGVNAKPNSLSQGSWSLDITKIETYRFKL